MTSVASGLTAGSTQFLDEAVSVCWTGERFVLRHSGGNIDHDLSAGQALSLLLLGENGNPETTRSTIAAVDGRFAHELDHVIMRFPTYLRGSKARKMDVGLWGNALQSSPRAPRPDQAAPSSVTWLLTLECNRRCPYCFYQIIPVRPETGRWPRDAALKGPTAAERIAEMGRIGVADLYLTGGEPMLRPDIGSIIAQASSHGIRVHMVSKFHMHALQAEALADAGLHHITISLDDLRPAEGKRLTGASNYPAEALASIEACLAAGLDLEVNAVVTSLNADGLGSLADRLEDIGCRKLSISAMQTPHFRSSHAKGLEPQADLRPLMDRLLAGASGTMAIDFGAAGGNDKAKPCGATLVCEVGRRSLHILPNGDATRCHYMPKRPDLVIGSLLTHSILDIWRSDTFERWRRPERSMFAGTGCANCGGFDGCNSRGRCVASAFLEAGQANAPDAFCGAS